MVSGLVVFGALAGVPVFARRFLNQRRTRAGVSLFGSVGSSPGRDGPTASYSRASTYSGQMDACTTRSATSLHRASGPRPPPRPAPEASRRPRSAPDRTSPLLTAGRPRGCRRHCVRGPSWFRPPIARHPRHPRPLRKQGARSAQRGPGVEDEEEGDGGVRGGQSGGQPFLLWLPRWPGQAHRGELRRPPVRLGRGLEQGGDAARSRPAREARMRTASHRAARSPVSAAARMVRPRILRWRHAAVVHEAITAGRSGIAGDVVVRDGFAYFWIRSGVGQRVAGQRGGSDHQQQGQAQRAAHRQHRRDPVSIQVAVRGCDLWQAALSATQLRAVPAAGRQRFHRSSAFPILGCLSKQLPHQLLVPGRQRGHEAGQHGLPVVLAIEHSAHP